nr:basic helix-loop-helix transcription factor [Loropetalum chinense var. rubrum]
MFEETACFDPNSISEGADDHGFSQTVAATQTPASAPIMAGSNTNSHTSFEDNISLSIEELSYHQNPHQEDDAALEQHLGFDMENCYNINNNNNIDTCNINNNTQLMPEVNQVMSFEQSNWDASVHEIQGMTSFEHPHNQDQQLHLLHEMQQNGHHHPQSFNSSTLPGTRPYINNPPTQDLLDLFHLPRCSPSSNLLPNSSVSFVQKPANFQTSLGFLGDLPTPDNGSASSVLYDPLFHLNLPPQPPLFRDLFQSLPNGYNLPASRTASLFGGGIDEREGSGGVYQNGDATQFDHGVLEFTGDIGRMGKRRGGKLTKQFTTESQRRDHLNASSILYDPLFHSNLPPQPPLFRDLFQSLPSGYNLPASRSASLFGGGIDDQKEGSGCVYQNGVATQFDNGVLKFTGDIGGMGKTRQGKLTNDFATERQRRDRVNGKFMALRSLVPSPSKPDRASIVEDAIEYIKELLRLTNELKILVEKKRCGRERNQRQKMEEDGAGNVENPSLKAVKGEYSGDQCYNGSLRSPWLQRKSKDTEVNVQIIDDEVTIKLIHRKKINCLLFVSRTLDELQLDLQHVAGGHNGDFYSFLINIKICEGSSVYASAIANKLIEVVDRQYEAIPPTSSF